MKEKFRKDRITGSIAINLGEKGIWVADKEDLIRKMVDICEDYDEQNYTLTLRQLYYQLVSKDYIPNHDKVYKKLSSLKDEICYNGTVDWSIFEDRGRIPSVPYYELGVSDALNKTVRTYRLQRQQGQEVHVEVWTEKDAISSILNRVTHPYGVTLVVNKGYTSSTALYGAYDRFVDHIYEGRKVKILYFGDHDPSGLDMIRDIRERLMFMFVNGEKKDDTLEEVMSRWMDELDEDGEDSFTDECYNYVDDPDCQSDDPRFKGDKYFDTTKAFFKHHFEIQQIGLTMEQIKEYNPPHNPAKITDPRAKSYVKQFGEVSWEVDALSPKIMEGIVEANIKLTINTDVYANVLQLEQADKNKIRKIVEDLNKK